MTAPTEPVLTRADRRLTLRLVLGLVAGTGVGLGFLLLALLVRANWDPLIDLDQTVAQRLHDVAVQHAWFVSLLKALSDVFDPITFRVVTTLVALVLLARRHVRLGAWTLVTVWGAALLGLVLKILVARTRPDLVDAVATAPGRSFPSGHALTSTVGCAVLLLLLMPLLHGRWRAVAVAVAVAIPLAVGSPGSGWACTSSPTWSPGSCSGWPGWPPRPRPSGPGGATPACRRGR